MADKYKDGKVILWRGIHKEDGEAALASHILTADPNAEILKDGDAWIIVGKAMMGSIPMIIKKN